MTSSTNAYSRLQTKGYEPEALLNFVALMGWSPQSSSSDTPDPSTIATWSSPRDASNEEVLPLAALVQAFSLEGVNKNRATMQSAKLDFLNRAHVRIKLADAAAGGGREDVARRTCAVVRSKWPELAGEKVDEPYIARVLDALKVRSLFPSASPSLVLLTAAATDTCHCEPAGPPPHDRRRAFARRLLLPPARPRLGARDAALQERPSRDSPCVPRLLSHFVLRAEAG